MGTLARIDDLAGLTSRRHRRTWRNGARAHIEVRGADDAGAVEELEKHLQVEVGGIDGVDWVALNAVTGRAVIAVRTDAGVATEVLLAAVEAAERAAGVGERRFPRTRPDHPADHEPLVREAAALAADVAGLGFTVVGRVARFARLPTEVAAIVPVVQSQPRLRAVLEAPLGPAAADVGLAAANAMASALAQGPTGLVLDAAQRGLGVAEALAVRNRWEQAEAELCPGPEAAAAPLPTLPERPSEPHPGTAERFAERAGLASVAAGAAAFALTRDPRRAVAAVVAGTPKATRSGNEAFAAVLGRTLAASGLVWLDRAALRRLDGLDSLIVDGGEVVTGTAGVTRLEVLDGEVDEGEVARRLAALLDAGADARVRRRGKWSAGPLARVRAGDAAEARREARARLGSGALVGVTLGDRLVAAATVAPELAPGARSLVATAREAGLMVAIATDDLRLVECVGADMAVASGDDLAASVRMLQVDGCRVGLVAAAGDDALLAADLGVGIAPVGGAVPWGADVVCRAPEQVHLVVKAVGAAKEVARQSTAIAVGGAGTAALVTFGGLPLTASRRALGAVNAAALLALVNGARAAVALTRHPPTIPDAAPPWHELDVDDVLERLHVDPERGLAGREVARRRPDDYEGEPEPSLLRSFLEELANPLTPVLAAGAALSAAVGSPTDAGIVGAVVGANALIGGIQRDRVARAVRELEERTTAQHARARRDGTTVVVPAEDLVVGDIVLLESGESVPADCRILEATHVEADESSLTGESVPVPKDTQPAVATAVAERTCMLYAGTSLAVGEATAVVVAVGRATEAGSALDVVAGPGRPGVEERLEELSRVTLPLAGIGGAVVTLFSLARRQPMARALGPGVNLAVAAVPEGLPLLATLAQLSSARRLAARGALVRNPRAIEALGRVDVLCIDKTGTLTQGRIRLRTVFDGVTARDLDDLDERFGGILAAGLRASPEQRDDEALPHMTDQAVVEGATGAGVDPQREHEGWQRRGELPFEPARGYHAVVGGNGKGNVLSVKGAPEVVLPRCARWAHPDGVRDLGHEDLAAIGRRIDRVARRGYRILAVAEREASDRDDLEDDRVARLTLLGFLGLVDPVRPEAAESVATLQAAGVDVVMVTGDHPSTAEGVAGELGILNGGRVLTGADLDGLAEEELDAVLPDVVVFSRVTPAQKVRIVAAFQARGRAVAMTGDGANDAPAIRLADVGVALGEGSTPAARGAADLVVPDGRVETIIAAVVEGRAMWASVRDALAILLGGNLGEVGFTVAGSLVGGSPPVSARQLLLVNLLTDVAPGLAIAVRPPADVSPEQLLSEGPEASLGRALERDIVIRAVFTAAGAGGAWWAARLTGRQARASTVALVALVGTQLGQTLLTGGRDPVVVAAGVGSAAVLLGIVQTPGISRFFGCTPLGPVGLAMAATSAGAATVGAAATSTVLARRAQARLERPQRHHLDEIDRLDERDDDDVIDVGSRPRSDDGGPQERTA